MLTTTMSKRKRLDDDQGPLAEGFVKRRRKRPIETGFAALSLAPTTITASTPSPLELDVDSNELSIDESRSNDLYESSSPLYETQSPSLLRDIPSPASTSRASTTRTQQVAPSTTEDVSMSASSWYEPEKDRESFSNSMSLSSDVCGG